jgi:hypothetical protein
MPAPANTVLPAITGTVEVGETIACSTGSWTHGVHSYAYQWQRINDSAANITGATASTYVIVSEDSGHQLQCVVTSTNGSGSTAATSAATIAVPDDWFVVEDGTGLSTAVSYASLSDADTYHSRRGNTAWTQLTVGNKKAALVKAADYLLQLYTSQWKGVRINGTQALDWPRAEVEREDYGISSAGYYGWLAYYPDDEVPAAVKNAACEAALSSITAALLAEQSQSVVREKVDVLEVQYSEYSAQRRRFPVIDGLLRPFVMAGNKGIRV